MIDREYAKSQINRLGELPFPPSTAEGIAGLITTLQEKSRSRQHAKRIIDAILEAPGTDDRGLSRWPTSERITRLAWDLLEDREKQRACEHCGGAGWISMTVRGFDCAKRCPCNPEAAEEQEEPVQKPLKKPEKARMPYAGE